MPMQIVSPRIRGFICLNAHPAGCAANIDAEIAIATARAPGAGFRDALVVGASTGYGLSSLVSAVFGYGARGMAVCLERPPHGDKTASAGWYNLAAVERRARERGREISVVNGDAFSDQIKRQTLDRLSRARAKLDCVIYSLASPKRTDPQSGVSYSSVLKPIGAPFSSRSINLGNEQVTSVEIGPATDAEIEATRKVMGGEDFAAWTRALAEADLLAEGCRVITYLYIGPALTFPIYRSGTIGKAKEDLEATARTLSTMLAGQFHGAAYVSVNKALVTQASAAIPVVPLYISLLYKIMKGNGTHEETIEQIVRLFHQRLYTSKPIDTDPEGRIRIDDWELREDVQKQVAALWVEATTETLP